MRRMIALFCIRPAYLAACLLLLFSQMPVIGLNAVQCDSGNAPALISWHIEHAGVPVPGQAGAGQGQAEEGHRGYLLRRKKAGITGTQRMVHNFCTASCLGQFISSVHA